jgi:hypothetical protein
MSQTLFEFPEQSIVVAFSGGKDFSDFCLMFYVAHRLRLMAKGETS